MSIDRPAIVAYLIGEADPDERLRVEDWRSAHPANEEEFKRVERFWKGVGQLEGGGEATGPSAGQIVALAKTRSRGAVPPSLDVAPRAGLAPVSEPDPPGRHSSVRKWGLRLGLREMAIAAALVTGVALGFSMIDVKDQPEDARQLLVTGAGESATVTLNDGTVVRVAPESRITFPGQGRDREVSLEGRAYFSVTEDEGRPFLVHLPDGVVRVLGTRFEVAAREDTVQVAVVEGHVQLSTRGQEVGLAAKQVARANGPTGSVEVEEIEDVFEVVDWLGGFLAFESTPMGEVVDEFQRRFGIQVWIADSSLLDRQVTGWFADQTSEQVIDAICAAIDAQCTTSEGVVLIESRSNTGG